MRYRISNDGKKLTVSIEDGDVVIASAPAATMKEAKALRDRAFREGPEALAPKKPAR